MSQKNYYKGGQSGILRKKAVFRGTNGTLGGKKRGHKGEPGLGIKEKTVKIGLIR